MERDKKWPSKVSILHCDIFVRLGYKHVLIGFQLTLCVAVVILLIFIVMHPNVDEDIATDLDLMRLGVKIIDNLPFHLFQTMKWLNFPGMVEEIAEMLQIQLDMRQEAIHLAQFNENFKDNEVVIFPKVRKAKYVCGD
jgi:hypothetical protein